MRPASSSVSEGWTAIVLAGQRPGVDPVALHFEQSWKALVPIAGEAMVTHVVRTLSRVPAIERIVVLAQEPGVLQAAVAAGGDATILTSSAGISASIRAVAGTADAPWPVLVTTADHPLLTRGMVEAFLAQGAATDLSIAMVERRVMDAEYPGTMRTWLRFRDGDWSGANLFAMRSDRVVTALTLWAEAEHDRKKAWKLFLHFGPWLALRAITRTIGLRDGIARAGRRLGLNAQMIALSDAEAAIDVDKPADHALATEILARRAGR
jgi:CTP:molybdopterin cytidylyltransferase MocA